MLRAPSGSSSERRGRDLCVLEARELHNSLPHTAHDMAEHPHAGRNFCAFLALPRQALNM